MPTKLTSGGGRYGMSGATFGGGIRNFTIRVASNARSIGGAMKVAAKDAEEIPAAALTEIVDWQVERAKKYSSGTMTRQQLRARRPGKYSTQRSPQKRDFIINAHVGTFRAGWRAARVKRQGKKFLVRLLNVAMPVAAFLILGTRTMRERPILQKIKQESGKIVNRVMSRLRMRLLRKMRRGSRTMKGHK